MSQLVTCLTLAQVMISWLVGSSPASGSVLTAQSWSFLQILCLPLPLYLTCSHSVSLSFKNKHTLKKLKKKKLMDKSWIYGLLLCYVTCISVDIHQVAPVEI